MIIKNVTLAQLNKAIRKTFGLSFRTGPKPLNKKGTRWSLTLQRKFDAPFGYLGRHGRHSGRYVCWHGHERFIRELYKQQPKTTVAGDSIRYRSLEELNIECNHQHYFYCCCRTAPIDVRTKPCVCGYTLVKPHPPEYLVCGRCCRRVKEI